MASTTFDFTVINMNTGKNFNGKANDLKETVDEILRNERPKLVFVQESYLKNGSLIEVPREEDYIFLGNAHSGFIVDNSYIDCQRLDLKTSVRRTYALSISQNSESIFFDLPRFSLCKIKSKRPPEFELLCACWHGPFKLTDPRKKSHLRSLLTFLLMIKDECGNLPLLLGGDFNLDLTKVKGVIKELKEGDRYVIKEMKESSHEIDDNLNQCRRKPKSKMLWILSNDFDQFFRDIDSDASRYESFDHEVLIMELQVATTIEDLKRPVQLSAYNKDPIVKEANYVKCCLNMRKLTKNENRPDFQMMSASWHGADAEYSDETKKESLKSALTFLQFEIIKRFDQKPDRIELSWQNVLRHSSTEENIHSSYNTLDTWIFSSSDKTLLYNLKSKNTNLKDIRFDLYHDITALIGEPSGSTAQQRHGPNSNPVDIHLDIVNMALSWPETCYIVTGYFNICGHLSANVLE